MTTDTVTIDTDPALKARHRAIWASGDYAAVASEIVAPLGPRLVDAVPRRAAATGCSTSPPAPATPRIAAAPAGAEVIAAT